MQSSRRSIRSFLWLVMLLHLELVDSVRSPYETFSSVQLSSHSKPPRIPFYSIPRGGGSGSSVPQKRSISPSSSLSKNGDNVGAKLEPIGKALVELGVAAWTFIKFVFDHQMQDPEKHIVEPLQRKINKALVVKDDRETIKESTEEATSTKKSFLLGNRVIRLSFIAWILSEALDLLGILHVDTPRLLKFQVDRVWYTVQPRVLNVVDLLKQWWSVNMTMESLESIPPKYNFALGTSVGMIAAPYLSAILGSIATPAILAYALAEGNALLQRQGRHGVVEFLDRIHNGIGRSLGRILEGFRKTVRSVMPEPQHIEGSLILTSGGSYFGGGKLVQQRQYRRSYLFPWRKVPISKAVAITNQDGGEPIHPMVAMIRHGFVVGSAIGFFLRT